MAYPTVSAPYGLKPINLIGGQVFAGSTRLLPIASAYGTNVFFGDVVKLASDHGLGDIEGVLRHQCLDDPVLQLALDAVGIDRLSKSPAN